MSRCAQLFALDWCLCADHAAQMQSMAKSAERGEKKTILNTLQYIYKENGLKGLYRGVTPRIGLGIWQTVCMVSFADYVKAWYGSLPSVRKVVSAHHSLFDTGSRVNDDVFHSFLGGRDELDTYLECSLLPVMFIASTLRSYQYMEWFFT